MKKYNDYKIEFKSILQKANEEAKKHKFEIKDGKNPIYFYDLLSKTNVNDSKSLNVLVGVDDNSIPKYSDISQWPHGIIGGATGSGKSVFLHSILSNLIIKNSPEELKLILVDPKMVEFSLYDDIPHLACPVLTSPDYALNAIKWLNDEMNRRYDTLVKVRCRNKTDYDSKRNEIKLTKMPYIVMVIEEFSDLVMQCGKELNDAIMPLLQKGRACGIHLIISTQRTMPSVLEGALKANVPARIAFRVVHEVDSVCLLDDKGAEELKGRGDMIFKSFECFDRLQGAYISCKEIEALTDYLYHTYGADYIIPFEELNPKKMPTAIENNTEDMALIKEIATYCVNQNACSINMIQNKFELGFNRSAKIVGILEDTGIVSKKDGTISRKILVGVDDIENCLCSPRKQEDKKEVKSAIDPDYDIAYAVGKYAVEVNSCAIFDIQSKFGLGFNRAARIVTLLEDLKVISKKDGNNPRRILVTQEQLKDIFENTEKLEVEVKEVTPTKPDDELLFDVAKYVVETNTCSLNSIQSKFSLGFNRVSRLVSMLEDMKIVSKKEGKNPRKVLVTLEELNQILKK